MKIREIEKLDRRCGKRLGMHGQIRRAREVSSTPRGVFLDLFQGVLPRGILGVMLAGACACGSTPQKVKVDPRPLPAGITYSGTWFSDQYGELVLEQHGSSVVGYYSKDERSGRVQGSVDGDLMVYGWTERRELVRGKPNETRGRGYFQLLHGDGERDRIRGEWGLGDNERGSGEWVAYRLKGAVARRSVQQSGAADAVDAVDQDRPGLDPDTEAHGIDDSESSPHESGSDRGEPRGSRDWDGRGDPLEGMDL